MITFQYNIVSGIMLRLLRADDTHLRIHILNNNISLLVFISISGSGVFVKIVWWDLFCEIQDFFVKKAINHTQNGTTLARQREVSTSKGIYF